MADLANELVGKTCYVGWPYLVEAKVWGLSDGQYWCGHDYLHKVLQLKPQEKDVWRNQVEKLTKL